jgi:hypothetical protein
MVSDLALDGTVHSGTSNDVNIMGVAERFPALTDVAAEGWCAEFIWVGSFSRRLNELNNALFQKCPAATHLSPHFLPPPHPTPPPTCLRAAPTNRCSHGSRTARTRGGVTFATFLELDFVIMFCEVSLSMPESS